MEVTKKIPDNKNFDGVQSAADMLNLMDQNSRNRILLEIESQNPQLADQIRNQMFTFDDLTKIEGNGIQILLNEVPRKQLVLALRNASEDLLRFLFSHLSQRAGSLLREEIKDQGPQKLSSVTAAQLDLIRVAHLLQAQGKISILK